MELIFQLIDCDYILPNNKPVIRLFGKTEDNKTVCAFYEDFEPYFYVLVKDGNEEVISDLLKRRFKEKIITTEAAHKFLPIGYKKEKTKLLKIVLKNPADTPTVRDYLREHDLIENVYEADILFKYRFMADFNLFGMKWIKAVGEPIKTNIVKTNLTMQAKKIENLNKIENLEFKYLSIDIETSADKGVPDPKTDQILIVSLSLFPAYRNSNTLVLVSKLHKKTDQDVINFNSEKEMLQKLIEIINEFSPDIITGYNINNFDLPFLNERLKINKLQGTIGLCNQKPIMTQKVGENKIKNYIVGRIIVDPYQMIREMVRRGFFRGLKRFGLNDVSQFFLNEQKLDVTHSQIVQFWTGSDEQFKKLLDYARKDAELALRLLLEKNFLDKYIGISLVSGLLLQDSLDTAEASKIDNILLREFNKDDYVIPCRPTDKEIKIRENEREEESLKGAFVLEPKVGLYNKSVVYLDFTSMYPSIYIAFNICPTTLIQDVSVNQDEINSMSHGNFVSIKIKQGLIPKIVKKLMEEREKVKIIMKNTNNISKKRALDAKQEALKRVANAFYGYTGYLKGRLYVLDIANTITAEGRRFIHTTVNTITKKTPYKVIYGDTDSIMVATDTDNLDEAFTIGQNIVNLINDELKGVMKLKIENVFKSLLILAKKRYSGWSFEKTESGWQDEIMMRGIETVRRDWCDLTSKTLQTVLEILLKEQNPKKAFHYVKDVLAKLEKNEIPIEDLVIIKSISKTLKDYKGIQPHIELVKKLQNRAKAKTHGVGDRVSFVIIKGTQLLSERAEDPEYVKQHGLKIDSKYYVESQLLPPLERVFEAIGIGKSELVGMGKQLILTEAIRNGVKQEEALKKIEGVICNKCNKTYRTLPLIGKCLNCSGELLFYFENLRSRSMML